ncbi:sulfatase-like hydrolase/transferase [Pseudomonas sp. RIT-To-2]|uniref:sulfatase-like hydrolase/transferase n=1 Tax=Pseudomonas sp. RIT-To-2 TaxID=3462541 RepID=UPI002413CC3D
MMSSQTPVAPQRPNFIIFVADQLRADYLPGFNPQTPVRTPALDRLAAQGVRFGQAFTQHSVCSPSRVSFLTGLYPHVHGHRTLQYLLTPQAPNFLRTFKDNGYHVVHAGARGDTFGPGAAEVSLHEHGFADTGITDLRDFIKPKPHGEPGSLARAHYEGERDASAVEFDEQVIRTAQAWLASAPKEPWVLYIPLLSPHPPFAAAEPWFSQYPRDAMPLPRHGSGAMPAFHHPLATRHGWDRLRPWQWQELRAVYAGMVSRLDSLIGRVMDTHARHSGGRPAYTAFFSDHGEYLGDYGLAEKWPAGVEECLVRTPVIIAGPGIAQGAQCDALVELIDLFPTLLDLAGIRTQHDHFGRAFTACLQDPAEPHRQAVFSEGGFRREEAALMERGGYPYDLKSQLQHEQPETVGKVVALRTREWTYVWRLYEPAQLFDRINDPHERHNLADEPGYVHVQQQLMARVLRWLVETADVIDPGQQQRFVAVELPRPGHGSFPRSHAT